MIAAPGLGGVLVTLPQISVSGVFWRVVQNRYVQGPPPGAPAGSAPQPLWPGGARVKGARYTPTGGPNSLYLAPDSATALAEVQSVIFDPAAGLIEGPAHDPLVVVSTRAQLPSVIDLCDPRVQRALGTSDAELTRGWLRQQARHASHGAPLPANSTAWADRVRHRDDSRIAISIGTARWREKPGHLHGSPARSGRPRNRGGSERNARAVAAMTVDPH